MTAQLLFLHGVGPLAGGDWLDGLNVGLALCGYPAVDKTSIFAPDYRPFLQLERVPIHGEPTETTPAAGDAHQHRGEYEIAQASLRRLLAIDDREPFRHVGPDVPAAAELLAHIGNLAQARKYTDDKGLRYLIAELVIGSLPREPTDLVVVGHSLGSLVAIDLLRYLPANITVRRLVTIGSPAGQSFFHQRSDRLRKTFPYGRVRSWLNVTSSRDAATAGRGVAHHFPAAEDIMIDLGVLKHAAFHYLADKHTARAVGDAMFGSQTKNVEPQSASTSVELRLSEAEQVAIFALAYAHRIHKHLVRDGPEDAARYGAALAVVQAAVADRMLAVAARGGRQLNDVLAALGTGHVPTVPNVWSGDPDRAVMLLIHAATTNLIEPYVVGEAETAQLHVLGLIASNVGYSITMANAVGKALRAAKAELAPNRTWKIVLIGAAGIALLATGPVGLALAGPAGLAGGAAITSALAAFGPGGMVGGMMLAGAAASTGAAATTAAVALASAPTASVELQVLRRMAHSYARKELKLPTHLDDWLFLSELQSQVANERALHRELSDARSPVVRALDDKFDLLNKAIDWMREHDLGPEQLA